MSKTRVAIVTGAAGGISEAIARRLAKAGCRVALMDVDADRCANSAGQIGDPYRAIAVHSDVSDAQAEAHAVDGIVSRLGPPAILVNNAGFARDVPFDQMTLEQWNTVQGVHLRGAFLMSRAVVP